jgi:glutaconyl-CoA/methylmalonyl-CoA decarboxylase subunit gamma
MRYQLAIGESKFDVDVGDITDGEVPVNVNGDAYRVVIENFEELNCGAMVPQRVPAPVAAAPPVRRAPVASSPSPAPAAGAGVLLAPIPGRILDIKVSVGEQVSTGQTVATMEAMKMENNIVSTIDGTVREIAVQKDTEVATGELIMIIE